MAALHIMQVLRCDFGAKRAFLLAALRPAGLLIYFQDFRSFSNPGIRRFLTDLDLAPPLPPPHPPCLSDCWRLQFVNFNLFCSRALTLALARSRSSALASLGGVKHVRAAQQVTSLTFLLLQRCRRSPSYASCMLTCRCFFFYAKH